MLLPSVTRGLIDYYEEDGGVCLFIGLLFVSSTSEETLEFIKVIGY